MNNRDTLLMALRRQHPEYTAKAPSWSQYRLLYEGGHQITASAAELLHRRRNEPATVYSERLSHAFYENYLGACIDWYAAALFRRPLEIVVTSRDATTESFFRSFLADCDRCGTSLSTLLRRQFINLVVYGRTHVLVDFPAITITPRSRAQEEELGQSRAYLVPHSPLAVTNWRRGHRGSYEWILFHNTDDYQPDFDSEALVRRNEWLVLTQDSYKRYEQATSTRQDRREEAAAQLVAEGPHALASAGRVPVVTWESEDGLWLANRAAALQIEHFNKSNALAWALHMGLFAMPVVYSDRDWNQVLGEGYYVQLGSDDRFGWTEPEGKVYRIAADNLERLRNEIYRVCYLLNQSGGQQPQHMAQSGLSKMRDFAITAEVLRSYAKSMKEFVRKILTMVATARGDEIEITIAGLDRFDEPDIRSEFESLQALESLNLPSTELRLEAQRRLASRYLADSDPGVLSRVIDELKASHQPVNGRVEQAAPNRVES